MPVAIAGGTPAVIIRVMFLIARALTVPVSMLLQASSVVIFPTMIVPVIVLTTLVGVAPTLVVSSIVVSVMIIVGFTRVCGGKCVVCAEREGCDAGSSGTSRVARFNTRGQGSASEEERE